MTDRERLAAFGSGLFLGALGMAGAPGVALPTPYESDDDHEMIAARHSQSQAERLNRSTYIDSLDRVHLVQVYAALRSGAVLARIVESLDPRCPIGTVVELVLGELRPRALFDQLVIARVAAKKRMVRA